MKEFFQYLLDPTIIVVAIGGILTSFFGFIAGVSKTEKTPKWIAWGSFIAGLIVLCGGILSGYQNEQSEETLQQKTEKIAEISEKNTNLAIKNSELNEKIASSITGGDTYCYLLMNASKSNRIDLILLTEGEYPLYDVEVRIHDLDKRVENLNNWREAGKPSDLSLSDFYSLVNKSAKIIRIGNIGKSQGYPLGTLTLPKNADKARYEIEIMARNGRVLQLVQYRRIDKKWIQAEKVYFRNKIVKKHIDPNFPKDDESKPFWDEK